MEKESSSRDETRNEIILKARDVLSRYGYKKTSTETIAKAMDKTKSSLYYYFKNRDEIIRAVLMHEANGLKNFILKAVNKEKSPVKKIQTFFYTRFHKIVDLLKFYKPVSFEYFIYYSYVLEALTKYSKDEQKILENILKEGIEQKIFDVKDCNLVATALIKSLKGFDFYLFQGEKQENVQHELEATLQILIRGLLTINDSKLADLI